jgi:ABC-type sugar transport system permease subunit
MNIQSVAARSARATPPHMAGAIRGLSDRAIAWLFIGPTMLILLMINIFPLIWTVKLSFTNFKANRPNAEILGVGIDNYVSVLTDPDIWIAMQTTAHFLFWTILLQMVIGFALAYLIDRKFRGHGFWTTLILGIFIPTPSRTFQLRGVFHIRCTSLFVRNVGLNQARAMGHHHCRHLDVDSLCDADLLVWAALHTRLHL